MNGNPNTRRLGDAINPYVVPKTIAEHDTHTLGTPIPPPVEAGDDTGKPKEKA